MKRFTALCLTLLLLAGLTACGGGKASPSTGTSQPENSSGTVVEDPGDPEVTVDLPLPEPLVDPEEIEWGYQAPGSSDTQYWYPDGDKLSDYYLMFEDGYLTVDDGGNRTTFDTAVEDWHIVNYYDDDPAFDFVFEDGLTCYDLIDGQWYARADYDAVVDALTAAAFVCEAGEQWNITFCADGTYSYNCDGKLIEGDWWLSDARTIEYNDDYGTAWFEITYDDASWEVVSLRDTDYFYPEY